MEIASCECELITFHNGEVKVKGTYKEFAFFFSVFEPFSFSLIIKRDKAANTLNKCERKGKVIHEKLICKFFDGTENNIDNDGEYAMFNENIVAGPFSHQSSHQSV